MNFGEKVDYIIDGGFVEIGVESTVVKVNKYGKIEILRPGKITKEELEKVVSDVQIDKHVLERVKEQEIVASPGMKYRHYAPNTKCVMVYSKDNQKMIEKINEMTKKNKKVIILGSKKNIDKYIAEEKWNMGENLEEIAKNIFTLLRKVDKYESDLVIIEGVEKKGIGLAIYNRLIRACEYNYLEIV